MVKYFLLLCSTLSGIREAALNVTSASQANSDINAKIQQAEKLALSANQTASSALNTVSHSNSCFVRQIELNDPIF